eukprot:364746-Chlamydomonas_euryale.AAC.9
MSACGEEEQDTSDGGATTVKPTATSLPCPGSGLSSQTSSAHDSVATGPCVGGSSCDWGAATAARGAMRCRRGGAPRAGHSAAVATPTAPCRGALRRCAAAMPPLPQQFRLMQTRRLKAALMFISLAAAAAEWRGC